MDISEKLNLINGDSTIELPKIATASVDSVISDPIYPTINKKYGQITEDEWHYLMDIVVIETRRILKPKGSAIFVLQANCEHIGRTRPWLWEFLAKWSKEWNIVQDIYWWNYCAAPTAHCNRKHGLTRPSVKYLIWLGPSDCYRNQDAILWTPSAANKAHSLSDRARKAYTSGQSMNTGKCMETMLERGGSTPFNLIPCNTSSKRRKTQHPAALPLEIAAFCMKYITKENDIVLDMFSGIGSVGEVALRMNRRYIGIEKNKEYNDEATKYLNSILDSNISFDIIPQKDQA